MVEVPTVTWNDIGGLEDVKKELQELVQVREWDGKGGGGACRESKGHSVCHVAVQR